MILIVIYKSTVNQTMNSNWRFESNVAIGFGNPNHLSLLRTLLNNDVVKQCRTFAHLIDLTILKVTLHFAAKKIVQNGFVLQCNVLCITKELYRDRFNKTVQMPKEISWVFGMEKTHLFQLWNNQDMFTHATLDKLSIKT